MDEWIRMLWLITFNGMELMNNMENIWNTNTIWKHQESSFNEYKVFNLPDWWQTEQECSFCIYLHVSTYWMSVSIDILQPNVKGFNSL